MKRLSIALFLAVTLTASHAAFAENERWNRFRGPNGSGVIEASGLPLKFGPDENVIWKRSLPAGHSSPVIWGDRIFLTAFENDELLTLCLDRSNGRTLWRRTAPRQRHEKFDHRNNPASPTPAVDGRSVFVFFPDFGLLAYSLEGEERWRLPLGPFNNLYGMGASPVEHGDSVFLLCDQSLGSYLLAVDKSTGKVRWRVERPEAKSGHSTPIVHEPPQGQAQLLAPGSFLLDAYAADSGEKVWWVRGLSFEMKSTPVMNGDMLYINGYASRFNQPDSLIAVETFAQVRPARDADGDGKISPGEWPHERTKPLIAAFDLDLDGSLDEREWNYYRAAMSSKNGMLGIRIGGRGDMTEKSLAWEYHRAVPQLPSPLLYRDVLYMINDGGIATSFRPSTGEVRARGRLKGALGRYYASPVAADGKIYMLSEEGKAAVLKPDGSLEVLAVNDLDSPCYATPAIADGRIYIRTADQLFAFGRP